MFPYLDSILCTVQVSKNSLIYFSHVKLSLGAIAKCPSRNIILCKYFLCEITVLTVSNGTYIAELDSLDTTIFCLHADL